MFQRRTSGVWTFCRKRIISRQWTEQLDRANGDHPEIEELLLPGLLDDRYIVHTQPNLRVRGVESLSCIQRDLRGLRPTDEIVFVPVSASTSRQWPRV